MTTAFVFSGGANLGAVQVGMLAALQEAHIRPDLLVGASVGAINAAWVASRGADESIDGLADVWCRLKRSDVFPVKPLAGIAGLAGRKPGLIDPTALRRLISSNISFDRIEHAAIPLHIVTTEVLSGHRAIFSKGPAVDVIAASAAIPGLFPPVSIDGRAYFDGGVVDNAPLTYALDQGVDTVYVLPTGFACALRQTPRSAISVSLHAVSLMINRRLGEDIDHLDPRHDVRVIPTPCPIDIRPGDFAHAADLIQRSQKLTRRWLQKPWEHNPISSHHRYHDHHPT